MYLEAELRSLQQGDMTINDYYTKLKRLAGQLCDIGHAVSEPSQVLNLLRGLNPRYRYIKPVITSKYPPHTFQSARSFLILEELSFQHDANAEAGQALTVTHGDRSNGSSNSGGHGGGNGSNDGTSGSSAPCNNPANNGGGSNRSNNHFDRRRKQGNDGGNGGGNTRSNNSNTQTTPWTAGFNPWQGMVQAWSMTFHAPSAGVLGPRPLFQPQQAMIASHLQPPSPHTSTNSFDTGASTLLCSPLAFHISHRACLIGISTLVPRHTCPPTPVISTLTLFVPHHLPSQWAMVLGCLSLTKHTLSFPLPPPLYI